MRPTPRRPDDADVIRARLRALLAEASPPGWVPDRLDIDPAYGGHADPAGAAEGGEPGSYGPTPIDRYDDDADADHDDGADARPDRAGVALPRGLGRHRAPDRTPRWDPGRLGARALWAAAAAAVALLLFWTWLSRPEVTPAPEPSGPPQAAASQAPATPSVGEVAQTSATVVVAVVGEVARPGLVTVPTGSRVADALAAAGGLLPDADATAVNLAAVVTDGQQIAVGVPGAPPPAGPGGGTGPGGTAGGVLDLNRATAPELDGLPGIGPVLAQRIVDHRARAGPFRSVDQLEDVPGIGPAVAGGLTGLVTV